MIDNMILATCEMINLLSRLSPSSSVEGGIAKNLAGVAVEVFGMLGSDHGNPV
jgi:hypothetical protein